MALNAAAPRPVFVRASLKIGVWDGLTPPTEYTDPINFLTVEINMPEQETVESRSNMIDDYGSVLDSQNLPTEGGVASFTFDHFTPDLLAVCLGADYSAVTQTGDEVVGEAVTTVLNLWVPLANEQLDSSVQPALDMTGAVDPAKYEVDFVNGMIKALHADAVGTGTIGYTKMAVTWDAYAAGQAKDTFLRIKGRALDKYTNKEGVLDIHKASLAPSAPFAPGTGEYLEGALEGKLIKPDGFSSPWAWRALT